MFVDNCTRMAPFLLTYLSVPTAMLLGGSFATTIVTTQQNMMLHTRLDKTSVTCASATQKRESSDHTRATSTNRSVDLDTPACLGYAAASQNANSAMSSATLFLCDGHH